MMVWWKLAGISSAGLVTVFSPPHLRYDSSPSDAGMCQSVCNWLYWMMKVRRKNH